jgi:hypothetical protein
MFMIETIVERPIPLRKIPAAAIPGQGTSSFIPTPLHRWCLLGVRGIRLESVMVGGRRCTSIEALNRFFQAVTAAANGDRQPMAAGSRARREQAGAVQEDVAWQKEQGA